MPRAQRARGALRYTKPPLAVDELVGRLSDRGLQVPAPDRAGRYLRHIGYYRLSPYTIPFQQGRPDHLFREGTAFDDVVDLYVFDRALRLLVMDALERVEVAVRAALTDHMSTRYDDPHWYVDASHFRLRDKHAGLLRIVRATCEERLRGSPDAGEDSLVHRSALEHYLTTYGSPELPPSWLMVETLTIGQLTSVYRNLGRRSDRTAVAESIGLTATVLESWMQTYVRVRNICAHHGRLWNVGLGVYPAIPTSSAISWLQGEDALPERSRKRLYPVLVSLQSVLDSVSPRSSWARRLHELVNARPAMNLSGMGIPETWAEDPFWSRHIA
ncbi:Abortive infection bacteriophage resistance protein [Saccharopolyspora antimicrobica]|uniref:Abortive infection bacteriophage resistance protein n=1 Tax=Saccharopolyspora antimicrobica TaxID=455193 RepID=A0A1I5HNV9_9PSEU|nr:Abi family protein [Saccharopolyspora antimicrobica]RKT82415.1 abortive infection bacteriophage resistance protein [Saccharopolyspora antimicrobica]SFO49943.1 Abortive infection bacteriophage resistance protein [Saccharopolyspora antimicrobica]